jgi:HlyD family secretion protein
VRKPEPNEQDVLARSMRRQTWAGILVVGVLFSGVASFSTMASISSAVIAPAVVAVAGYPKKVQHLEGGIVSTLQVRNGDAVEAGAILVQLDDTEATANLEIIRRKIDEYNALRKRLKAEIDGAREAPAPSEAVLASGGLDVREIWDDQARIFNARREARTGRESQLNERIAQLQQVTIGLQAQQTSLARQMALIEDELNGLEELEAQQLVAKTKIASVRREAARLAGEHSQHQAEIAKTNVQVSEIKLQIAEHRQQFLSETLAELRDVDAQLAEAREKDIALSARLGRMTILAPQSGVVHKLTAHTVGGVVAPGDVIMEIVPQEDELLFEGRLDPAYVDQVAVGQKAGVRLVALDQTKTPEVEGSVTAIAPDVRSDGPNTPPYYAISVRLEPQVESQLPARLVPGMPVELLIKGQDRTVLNYLVKPLTDRIAHTFREQ